MNKLKKVECETAIRSLNHEWAASQGLIPSTEIATIYSEFRAWLESKGNSHFLKFRSVADPDFNAKMWFDDEMKQNWRR